MIKIVRAAQTSFACPSQWDAWTDDGRYVYLRFRHGHGTVTVYPSPDTDTWDFKTPPVASFEDDDEWNGVISLEEFCERAGIELAASITEVAEATRMYWTSRLDFGDRNRKDTTNG